ncbi:hypothetical protein L1987_71655 [Smallanthus sonchifolius]|uniref:Uncharacterized protein n=1 Tax=Smallanthus sonchifolius TaxID=185202 RepID=A0ACB9AS60_9ASTR|nr:hypothetical protein L1987_71655 [Smallanthus sonchifolius]
MLVKRYSLAENSSFEYALLVKASVLFWDAFCACEKLLLVHMYRLDIGSLIEVVPGLLHIFLLTGAVTDGAIAGSAAVCVYPSLAPDKKLACKLNNIKLALGSGLIHEGKKNWLSHDEVLKRMDSHDS